jgi:PD-(D/E)XK nuclease superfamily
MTEEPSQQELVAAHCWERDDRVPGQPEMTAFRRRIRLHQARWREAKGYPIGSQPIVARDGTPSRLVGSRMPLDYARETGANFLSAAAHDAVTARLSVKEREQSIDAQRLWADLLWSPAMCFNLFGELAADHALADRAIHAWWPDVPGTVCDVRFLHSPGWLDPSYTGSLMAFDVAFVLDRGDGTQGIVGVTTRYHERLEREVPKPERLARYEEIVEMSGAFTANASQALDGDLVVMWLQHLLVLSMLQHPGGAWSWGRFVVVHPAGNTGFADACARYRSLITDASSYASVTVEELLDAPALPKKTRSALVDRYLSF